MVACVLLCAHVCVCMCAYGCVSPSSLVTVAKAYKCCHLEIACKTKEHYTYSDIYIHI